MRSVPKCAEVCQIRAEIAAKICPKFCAGNADLRAGLWRGFNRRASA